MRYETVKSIRPIGTEETVDLTTVVNGNFLLKNGLVSHNSGKSALATRICEQLDPDFSAERVFFFLDELFPLVRHDKLPPGSFALIDEAGASLDARRFMSAINVHSTHVFEAFGIKQVSVVFTLPSLKMIDANVRRLMHCMAFQRDRGYARIYRIGTQYDGAVYSFRIGKFLGVKMPSKKLWDAYLKKKWKFLDAVLDQAIGGFPTRLRTEPDWTSEEITEIEGLREGLHKLSE